jgi:hypothetical protein
MTEEETASQFASRGLRIRARLQEIEDELLSPGYDDYVVATEHGSFRWQTVERARAAGSWSHVRRQVTLLMTFL